MRKNTTAENYRQFIDSPAIQTAKYFFNILVDEKYTNLENYISEIKTGKTPSKSNSKYYNSNDINWFKPSDIGNGIYLLEATSRLSKIAKDEKKITDFKKNTLLITCIGDIGRMGILKENSTSNQQITGILLNDKVIPEYVYLYLAANRELFTEKGVLKTTLPIINQKVIKNLQIKVPSIDLQKQIVEFFLDFILNKKPSESLLIANFTDKVLDFAYRVNASKTIGGNLTTEMHNQQTLLKKLRQSILQEAIEGKLTASWREQNPDVESASVLLEKIKDEKEQLIKEKKIKKQKPLPPISEDEIPFDIPESWEWCRLKNIGKITGGGTPSKHIKRFWNGDIPWISPKDMKSEYIHDSELKITQLGIEKSSAKLIEKNSLLLVGRSGILKRKLPVAINLVPCTVNQDMKVLIPFKPLLIKYLQIMMMGMEKIILKDLVKFGMTVHSLKYSEFEIYPFPVPPLKEQKEIVKKIEKFFKICDELETQIDSSKANSEMLIQAVLKEAFEK